jgi:thymidylate kinase
MLKAVRKMDLRASHLLFSFNRWEKKEDIVNILNSGTNLIIDRYAFSGYCYSVCNVNLNLFILILIKQSIFFIPIKNKLDINFCFYLISYIKIIFN